MMDLGACGVVGAGLMGREIALTLALAGHEVTVIDVDEERLAPARAALADIVEKAVSKGRMDAGARAALDRVRMATALSALGDSDFVVEAVIEDAAVKREVFAKLASVTRESCILASNTSTIPISTLAHALPPQRRPGFIGLHFFSPVTRMPLVEVIPGFETAPAITAVALKLLEACGKTPILVKDVAGFAVNRMFNALLIEAIRLVDEGVISAADADRLCQLGLGHPVGPFKLMDTLGLDLTLQAQSVLHEAYGERFRPPALLKQKVAAGHVGKRAPGWLRTPGG